MNVAVFSLPSYEAVQKVYTETKTHLGEILSAFEFFDKQAYDLVRRHQKEGGEADRKVFETEGEFYVLVETGGSKQEHDEEVSYRLIVGDESLEFHQGCSSLNKHSFGTIPLHDERGQR